MENIPNGINIDGVDLDDFAFEKFDNENLAEEVRKLNIDKEVKPMPSNQMAISSDESEVEKNPAVVQQDSASKNLETIIAALPISDSLKDWQKAISVDLRSHLVGKLVKAIFPYPLPEAIQDQRIKDLISYAKKVEKDMFEMAPDKEAYYHMLAEKIYKIQKELMEKKKQRREREQQNQQNE